jgi:CheY-like chemotaxis protein
MALNFCTSVLIVEDDAIVALMMEAIVEDLGYRVHGPSTDFDAALYAAQVADLDYALLDFYLADGQSAAPIADALEQRGIPFAFTTGGSPDRIRQAYKDAPIISKPVVEDELLDLLP